MMNKTYILISLAFIINSCELITKDGCSKEKQLVIENFNKRIFVKYEDESWHYEPDFNKPYLEFREVLLKDFNLNWSLKDTSSKTFNILCFNNAYDKLLKIKYGTDFLDKVWRKADSLHIVRMSDSISDGVFKKVDLMPSYKSGTSDYVKYIESKITELKEELDLPSKGKICFKIIVDTNGCITNPTIVYSNQSDLINEKCKEILLNMPKWNSGELFGKKVNVETYSLIKIY